MTTHVKECRSEAEIVATYRAAHDRLWNPPSIRIANPLPKPKPTRPVRAKLAVTDIALIQFVVARCFHIPFADMTSTRRKDRFRLPRLVAIHLARTMTVATKADIGRAFKRHHTTVGVDLDIIAKDIASDTKLALKVLVVRDRVLKFHEQQQREGA